MSVFRSPRRPALPALLLLAALAIPSGAGPLSAQVAPPPRPDRAAPDTGATADGSATAEASPAPMTLDRLAALIEAVDPEAERRGNAFQLHVAEAQVIIVTDPVADRMRILVPVRPAEGLSEADLTRIMQANFDSALDARYAIARGTLWSAFIHPLGPLGREEFLSGLGQTVNLAKSYGTSYASGALVFGGGDSAGIQRKLIEDLLKKGEDI